MAMVNVPHFDYPFRFGRDGSTEVVEQNSQKDIMNCVTAACKTTRGTRLYVPEFGIDDPTFSETPLDTNAIVQQIRQSEPRANVLTEETIVDLVDELTIGVGSVE